jgi:hypothetical protein
VNCHHCSGPLPAHPYSWTHEHADYVFCSGRCRDLWLERQPVDGVECCVCHGRIALADMTFEYRSHKSRPIHKGCVGRG